MKKLKLFYSFIHKEIYLYLLAIFICLISVWISLYIPIIVKVIIDSIIGHEEITFKGPIGYLFSFRTNYVKRDLLFFSFCSVVIVVVTAILQFIYKLLITVISQRVSKRMKDILYEHIQLLDFEYHSKAETGDLIQRCTTDIEKLTNFASDSLIELTRVLFVLVITVKIMFSLNVEMSLVSMVLIPVIVAFSISFFKKTQKVFENEEKSDALLVSTIQENLTGVRVVKAFARQKYEINKFYIVNKDLKDRRMDVIVAMSMFWSVSDVLTFIQIVIVLVFGSYAVVAGIFGIGMIVAFFTYVMQLMWPVKELGQLLTEFGKSRVSLKRLYEVLKNTPETLDDSDLKPKILGSIEFVNVSFSYPNGIEVLKKISFKIEAGKTLAIIGPTGSGKSTLVHLLHRLYDGYTGDIYIDGVNIRDISRNYLRRQVGLILQEPFLFNRTVEDNIGFTKEGLANSEITDAAKISCVHNSISTFDKGYKTMVGEGGVTLSGGQKQRIAIARTLVCNNPIIIFDDSLSAVDTETDKIIRENILNSEKSPTTIIISHRVSTIREADLILVLEDGKITAKGKDKDIRDGNNLYGRIISIQNEVEEEFHTVFK